VLAGRPFTMTPWLQAVLGHWNKLAILILDTTEMPAPRSAGAAAWASVGVPKATANATISAPTDITKIVLIRAAFPKVDLQTWSG
jgi:hypothetical protein